MKDIMLVCSAGMSTSLLVVKMEKVAKEKGVDVKIFAVSEGEAPKYYDKIGVLLLGPQVRYLKKKMDKTLEPFGVPVEVINSMHYGTLNGEAVLDVAIEMMK